MRSLTQAVRRAPPKRRMVFSGLCCLLVIGTALAQNGAPFPPLTSETPSYQCHVASENGDETIIRIFSHAELPERFSDIGTLEAVPLPDSTRRSVFYLFECVRLPGIFESPHARELESIVPR
jgi:hypothetical protein